MRVIFRGLIAAIFGCLTTMSLNAANFFPVAVSDLIADINTANNNNEDDVIHLEDQTFTLTAINNDDNNEGFNGLPSILPDNSHQIIIKDGTIERDPNAPAFRLIRVALGAKLILKKVVLRNGLANDDNDLPNGNGGGAILNDGHLSIIKSQLTNNVSNSESGNTFDAGGGAILNAGGTIDLIERTTFSNNSSLTFIGGAIINTVDVTNTIFGVITKIDKSTFSDNFANFNGGAIGNFETITEIIDSTFSDNTAGGGGAILNAFGGEIHTIINSTFSGNSAIGNDGEIPGIDTGDGGAISNVLATIDQIFNSTIANNEAILRGGGISNLGAEIGNLESDIIAQNTACFGPDISNVGSTIFSASFNLIGTDEGHSIVNGVDNNQVGTLLNPLNPLLGPLQNNGGPTFTLALLPGSPAIDKGSNPDNLKFDQRGPNFLRTVGLATDVGAFEVQAAKKRKPQASGGGGSINPGLAPLYPVPFNPGFPGLLAPPIPVGGFLGVPSAIPAQDVVAVAGSAPDVGSPEDWAEDGKDGAEVGAEDQDASTKSESSSEEKSKPKKSAVRESSGCSSTNSHPLVLLWLMIPLLLRRRRVKHI